MADPQTADQFFGGPDKENLPSSDQFFGTSSDEPAHSSPALDGWLAAPMNTTGKILDAFGQGAKQSWGTEPIGLDEGTADSLRKAGVFNDWTKGQFNVLKGFNESVVRVSAAALDVANRGLHAAIGGAESAAYAGGTAVGGRHLGEAAAGVLEYEASRGDIGPHPSLPGIPKAQSLSVIGKGEDAYFGTREGAPLTPDQHIRSAKEGIAQQAELTKDQPPEPLVGTQPATPDIQRPAAAPEPDIHSVARQIAPEVFNEYDALSGRRDTFRRWLDELSVTRAETPRPQVIEMQNRISDILDKVGGVEDRLTKAAASRLEDARSSLDDLMSRDTPDMALVRESLIKTDYRMRDLAPQVSSAYRQASGYFPESVLEREPEQPEQATQEAQEEAPQQDQQPASEQAPGGEAPKISNENVPQDIAGDITQKLVAAGRPQEEAQASAQIVKAYYDTRAQRFEGAKGSPEELYQSEAPDIQGGEVGGRKGAAAGKTSFKNGKSIITLFSKADASTFMHETGHQWLEDMMKDAADEKAPEGLKNDAQSVRKWLGADETGEIKGRQHEKFARGFERYLMEGRAPTRELASVFEKFKNWLTAIYQTVSKLRSPITDDIRDVFDRLLSTTPNRRVVAEDVEAAKSAADTHEDLAENTPPEKAHEVADQIRTEIDEAAKQGAPEVYAELTGQTSGVAGENEGATGGGNEAGTTAAEVGTVAEPREVAAGRDEAAAESAEQSKSEPDPDRPLDANQRLASPETRLLDKAGNIRLDNLATPEDVNYVIRETATENSDFMSARRGVLSDHEVLALSDAIGEDPAFLDGRKIGEAFNAEQIIAARKLLIESAKGVRDAMAKAAEGSDADVLLYGQAKLRHRMIQEHVSGVTAEAGRALRAFRSLEGGEEAADVGKMLETMTGKTLFQMRNEAKFGASLNTAEQVSKFVNDTTRGKLRDAILEYYINCLISGPITHMRYMVGNALSAIWRPLIEIPTASVFGIGRDAEKVHLGEAGAQIFAMTKGAADGWRAAVTAFKSGSSPLLPGERLSQHLLTPREAIPGKFGQVMRIPSKSVSAIHSFFKSLRYEQNIQGLAYRTAMDEKLEGDAFQNRIAELTQSPTEEMMQAATSDALRELYMAPTDYNSLSGYLTRAANSNIAVKIIVPFMKIGTQITRNAFLERTPLGFVDKDIRANLLGENGKAARDFQMAKMTAGISLMGATVGLCAEGLATGDGPEDPRERAVWMMNHTPNSIQVGEVSIPYQGLGSLGMLMRFSANAYQTAQGWDEKDGETLAISALEGISKSVLDENFMRGVKDLLDALYHPQEYGASYLKNFVTNWIPFSVGLGQVSREVDPYWRDTHGNNVIDGILKAAQAKIPGMSQGLMARRDMFGEPIPSGGPDPSYFNDPILKELEALQIKPGFLSRKIRSVPLTDQQYDDYSRIAGRLTRIQLQAYISMPWWHQAPVADRFNIVKTAIDGSRESARTQIMMQYPDIVQKAMDAKVQGLQKPETVH